MVRWLSFKNVNFEGVVRMALVANRPWFARVFPNVAVYINLFSSLSGCGQLRYYLPWLVRWRHICKLVFQVIAISMSSRLHTKPTCPLVKHVTIYGHIKWMSYQPSHWPFNRDTDKQNKNGAKLWLCSYSFVTTLVFVSLLVVTHNICPDWEIRTLCLISHSSPFLYEWIFPSGLIQSTWDIPLYISRGVML